MLQNASLHFLFFVFWPEWLLSQKWLFLPENTFVKFEVAFCQIWSGFLARNALLLKVLKGLARLWWLKAFRLVFLNFVWPSHITLTLIRSRILKEKSIYDIQKHKYSCQCINSQYFWKWTNANPMKIFGQAATASKL